jgi:hypothetical protein
MYFPQIFVLKISQSETNISIENMEEMHKRYCSKIVVEKEYMGHIGIDGRMIKYP